MPWRDDVAAIVLGYFGGQEFGNAIADVLVGLAEPGGRLPATWPAALEDVPVLNCTPEDGTVRYGEGLHIGHRAWLKAGAVPAFEFGHGLGYTSWELADATVAAGADGVAVTVGVTNTGSRAGKHVVQVYASREDSAVDRPVRWLAGFAPVRLEAGESAVVGVNVPRRRFQHYAGGRSTEPGTYTLHVGSSVTNTPLTMEVDLS